MSRRPTNMMRYDVNHVNIEYRDETYFHDQVKGNIGFICPHCGYSIICSASINNVMFVDNGDFYVSNIYHVTCGNCNMEFIQDTGHIDPNIAEVLSTLNKKGYQTEWSCEGHPESNTCVSIAYIVISNPNLKVVLNDYPLPKSWIVDDNEWFHIETVCDWEKTEEDTKKVLRMRYSKKQRIKDLMVWAESLPEASTILP